MRTVRVTARTYSVRWSLRFKLKLRADWYRDPSGSLGPACEEGRRQAVDCYDDEGQASIRSHIGIEGRWVSSRVYAVHFEGY